MMKFVIQEEDYKGKKEAVGLEELSLITLVAGYNAGLRVFDFAKK